MPDTLEVRIAHLEGAYEQIDKRLSDLRQDMTAGFAQVRQEMTQLRQHSQEQFRWILGFQSVTWISILGTLLAILFRR